MKSATVSLFLVLDFPKRPLWDYSMTKRQVEEREEQMFSKYFKGIRDQYRPDQLSWFEKNLEVRKSACYPSVMNSSSNYSCVCLSDLASAVEGAGNVRRYPAHY